MRASYFYFRLLDDVVDGDRESSIPVETLLAEQLERWRSGTPAGRDDEANTLFDGLWVEVDRRTLPAESIRAQAVQIIEGFSWDWQRRREHRAPSRRELEDYYDRVILAPTLLAHAILEAQAAPAGLREMARLIGRLQSARDLHADWDGGLINIPHEEMAEATAESRERWRKREAEQCARRLGELWHEWGALADERSRLVLSSTVNTLLKWASYHAQHGH
jgi:phytoene/squalene synthetase